MSDDADAAASPARRRAHVPSLAAAAAVVDLSPDEARHLVAALRLGDGADVELFDDAGRTVPARLRVERRVVRAELVGAVRPPPPPIGLVVACAVPKAERADWLAEKLCEVGVDAWVPLIAARSTVRPGAGKVERWRRVAVEAAKQCGRAGPMRVEAPVEVGRLEVGGGAVLLDERGGAGVAALAHARVLIVGPEGGWTDAERAGFVARGAGVAHLPTPVLRVETAAVVAAGVALALRAGVTNFPV